MMQKTSILKLINQYDALLFDAYGVLVRAGSSIDYSIELMNHLNAANKPYLVLTNGSSNSPENTATRYQKLGLPIDASKVITSGSLVKGWLEKTNSLDDPIYFLGPQKALNYFSNQGLRLEKHLTPDSSFCLIANQDGFDWLPTLDSLLSHIFKRMERGLDFKAIIPNPDIIYPSKNGVGLTSGAIAQIIESAVYSRSPNANQIVIRLGKPYSTIFDLAKKRFPKQKLIMIGDQLGTDISGANAAKIDSALVETGLSRSNQAQFYPPSHRPKFYLDNLKLI